MWQTELPRPSRGFPFLSKMSDITIKIIVPDHYDPSSVKIRDGAVFETIRLSELTHETSAIKVIASEQL